MLEARGLRNAAILGVALTSIEVGCLVVAVASAQYVYNLMSAAGYNVSFQEFTFNFDGDQMPPALEQASPTPTTYVDGVDYDSICFSKITHPHSLRRGVFCSGTERPKNLEGDRREISS